MSSSKPLSLSTTSPNRTQAAWAPVAHRNLWLDAWRRLLRNRAAVFGLVVAIFLFLMAIFGPAITPYDPFKQNLNLIEEPPSLQHLFGTDELGRDVLSRLMWGARTAVLVALLVTTVSTGIGAVLGGLGGYLGGLVDSSIMRVADVLMGFPHLLLAVFVSAMARQSVSTAMHRLYELTGWEFLTNRILTDYLVVFGALALVEWYVIARLVRGQVLSLKQQDYTLAARALGASDWRIVRQHMLPNALGPVIVAITVGFGAAMLRESSLSYLGIGIQPPGASWGAMISDNLAMWRYKPHLVLMPGLILAIAVLGFNFLGDGLNDALNPRQSQGWHGKSKE